MEQEPTLRDVADLVRSMIPIVIEVKESTANVSSRIDRLDENINTRFEEMDASLNSRIDGLDSSLNARIDGLDSSLNSRIDEVIEVIQEFSSETDLHFAHIDERLDRVELTMVTKDYLERRLAQYDSIIAQFETKMVTKDYLDNKLADLRGDLIVLARKGNTKLSTLVDTLVADGSLKPDVARRIMSAEPFPQI